MSSMAARASATVVVTRDGREGLEVLLLKRASTTPFVPDRWVFPGGALDAAEREASGALFSSEPSWGRVFSMTDAQARGLACTACRELVEEAGLSVSSSIDGQTWRGPLLREELSYPELLRRLGTTIDPAQLKPWSRWVTPKGRGRRYDTVFFVARAVFGEALEDRGELVEHGWFSPAAVLAAGPGAFLLAPPTWCTLLELSRFDTAEEMWACERGIPVPFIEPVRDPELVERAVLLPGHEGHPAAQTHKGLPIRLERSDRAYLASYLR